MAIGSNIRKRRYELKMSQQDLADAMGYKTRATISKIESEENDVSNKKLLKFAQVLDTTVENLLFGVNATTSNIINPQQPMDRNKNIAIILAGGKSSRNEQNIPNQFIDVNGKPIIIYGLETYNNHPLIDDIYVVCLKGWESIVDTYCKTYNINKLKGIITAGNTGILSIKKAIDYVKDIYDDEDIIIFQESTRPLVSIEMISKLINTTIEYNSAYICKSMKDYIMFTVTDYNQSITDRKNIVEIQSPDSYKLSYIIDVFNKADKRKHEYTESCLAYLLNKLGYQINFIEGSFNNIKIIHDNDVKQLKDLL